MVCGQAVSRDFYLRFHNISHSTVDAGHVLLRTLTAGEPLSRVGLKTGRFGVRSEAIELWLVGHWLKIYSMTNARDGRPHLCFIPVATWIWRECEADIGEVGYSTFLRVFIRIMRGVSYPRSNDDLKHCGVCFKLHCDRVSAAKSGDCAGIEKAEAGMRHHIAIEYGERTIYWDERGAARRGEARFTLISMDGTRPLKFPSFVQRTGESMKMHHVHLELMSIIVHNELDCGGHIGMYLGHGSEDANVNVSYLNWILERLSKAKSLERVLHLQLDGGSAAKCRTMIGYLARLVESKRLDEIIVRFSIAEHGGDMNDGMTSHLRVGVRKQACVSPLSMEQMWKRLYRKEPRPDFHYFCDFLGLEGENACNNGVLECFKPLLYDWRAFLGPNIHSISGYCQKNVEKTEDSIHVWKFLRNSHGKAELRIKRLAQEPIKMWSGPQEVLRSCPAGDPARIFFHEPNPYTKRLKYGMLEICDSVLRMLGSVGTEMDREWWTNFRDALVKVELPKVKTAESEEKSPKKRKKMATKRSKRVVDRLEPPVLRCSKQRQPKHANLGFDFDDGEIDGISDDSDDEYDGTDPRFFVEEIVGQKTEDGVVLYRVRWAKPYDDETWEPIDHLNDASDKIADFHARRAGLSVRNKQFRDLNYELYNQEQEEKEKNRQECEWCGNIFNGKRGVAAHQRYCKSKPLE